jgi:dolichyl-diphosphooligosaccharide--protein glycosyltransferase
MEWLKAHSPTPGQEPTYGILGGAMLGHFIELWAERPAMASTFSQTSWHVAANAEAARILASQDDDDAWREARSQRMAFVVLMPHQQLLGVSETEWPRALARRLYERDGSPHFPLLFTSPEKTPNGDPQLKVFGVEGVLTGDAGTE